jgi:hypothetical protein
MQRICTKCGGLLIGERPMDFYLGNYWKCVNCGWSRQETLMRSDRAMRLRGQRVCRQR